MSKSAINVLLGAGSWGTNKPEVLGDKAKIQEIIDEFKKHGHNQIDSARVYGEGTSEGLLAELGYADQGLIVDTKIPPGFFLVHNAENINKALEASLTALNTKKVHVLYLHGPDRNTPCEETLAAVNEAYKKGHFEKFGLSNFRADEVEKFVQIAREKGYVQPTVYEGMYNLVARNGEKELFPVLRKYGISFNAYSPLAGSFLTDEMKRDKAAESSNRFNTSTPVGNIYNSYYFKDSYFQALDKLKQSAKQHGIAVQEIAIRWLTHHSILKKEHGDGFIVGGQTFSKIKAVLEYADLPPLPEDVLKVANEAWEIVKNDAGPYTLLP